MRTLLINLTQGLYHKLLHPHRLSQKLMSSKNASPFKMFEIERKFVIPEGLESRLQALGAEFIERKTFHDIYYDSEGHRISLNDHWLRQRDDAWHLKLPPATREQDKKTAQYVEIGDSSEILSHLVGLLDASPNKDEELATFVRRHCTVMADFVTNRTSYNFENCRIDLDNTNFGYSVGEVEVLVTKQEEVQTALDKVETMATKLGLQSERRTPGKLDTYLKKNDPAHYELLVEAKIFGDVYQV